jgi:hypothetical protein
VVAAHVGFSRQLLMMFTTMLDVDSGVLVVMSMGVEIENEVMTDHRPE